jgi:hypothetical protein
MKTNKMNMTVVLTMAFILITIPSAWAGMMGGGYVTTTIPGGGSNTTTTINGGGMTGGGGYMGGSGMMSQYKAADLNGDDVPEIVYIARSYLVILDNTGKIKTSKLLPAIPGVNTQPVQASAIEIADLDGDQIPEIITQYWGNNAYYLVILDNQGNYKSSQKLPWFIY